MKSLIKLSEHFDALSSRPAGAEARKQLLMLLSGVSTQVIIDFEFRKVSPSFADESIGLIAAELGKSEFKKRLKIINTTEQARAILKHVIKTRVTQSDYRDEIAVAH
ncbi:STAS-like domain-containing protein [Alteromonas sp. S015]|uniref:STAS-like domain-containing protein n=1 Tax=Alteromonas sp. S015 TaxID=3117401 RepID=UPI002FE15595